jgi:hypothetical protein
VGAAGGEETIDLPGAALRSSAIQLMGSGVKSMPLAEIAEAWAMPAKPRIVVTVP